MSAKAQEIEAIFDSLKKKKGTDLFIAIQEKENGSTSIFGSISVENDEFVQKIKKSIERFEKEAKSDDEELNDETLNFYACIVMVFAIIGGLIFSFRIISHYL